MENIVFNLYAKFNDDRSSNEKALVHWKFDNNNPKHKNNNARFRVQKPRKIRCCPETEQISAPREDFLELIN